MMKQNSTKSSSFARQIFIQFLASSLVPVVVLSFFAFITIEEHFDNNINRQVYSESRTLGLTLFDRLEMMESSLLFLGRALDESTAEQSWLRNLFSTVYVYERGKVSQLLYGQTYSSVYLTEAQRQHLQERALLYLQSSGEQYELMMVTPLDIDNERYLVGVVNKDFFWDLTTKETDFYCAGILPGQILYCSGAQQRNEQSRIAALIGGSLQKDEYYSLSFNDQKFVGNTWNLFIQPQFGLKQIQLHYFIPQKAAFKEYDFFSKVFPQTIVIVLLLVYLLSSIQVRRAMQPLKKLTAAAREIIDGNYGVKVDIKSHNEFETLGSTFNDLSLRIHEQLTELQTLAKLDRLILSTPDTEYIVDTLLRYIPQVIPLNSLAFVIFDSTSFYMGTVYYHRPGSSNLEKTSLILNEDEYEEIDETSDILQKDADSNTSYLGPLNKFNNEHFLIVPVRNKEVLLGAFVIGLSEKEFELTPYSENVPALADRAAVALSNANWEKKLFNQAHYDELTGLPNRFLFKDRFQQAVERAKRNKESISILFLDLDRFKNVNDSLGHDIGDRLLQEVGNRFVHCVRTYDSVARFGGDEFVIIITDVAPEHIQEQSAVLAERIIQSLKQPILLDEREFFVSPSIGIAIYPEDGKSYDELMKQADTAMYEAKAVSTASYKFYEKNVSFEPLARLELENDLRHALANDQLRLFYQPKVNLRDGLIDEVEALIRWDHPSKGMILPDVFISLAEETGMIADIGYWVLREACLQSKRWQKTGSELKIALNISSDQFRQPRFFENVVDILKETEVDPNMLEMEITESIYIDNHEKTTRLLNQLKEIGIGICIDDFGTGYSSMTYLQHIPVDKLKIDKSFIEKINEDKGSASIIKAIITLAHSLDLRVVAEGVETRGQYVYLNAVSCDEAQGYYICHPLPPEEVVEQISKTNVRAAVFE